MTPLHSELLKAWFLLSFSLGSWTCLNLLATRRGDKNIKHIILCLIVLLLIPPLNAYINLISDKPIQWFLTLSQRLTWCYGPILIALIRHAMLRPQESFQQWIQFLPFGLVLVHDLFRLQLIDFPIVTLLLFTHVFTYIAYALYLLNSTSTRLTRLTTQFKNTTYYWLMFLVCGLLAIMLFDVVIYTLFWLNRIPPLSAHAGIACLIAIYINKVALFSLYQPDIFFHDQSVEENPMTHVRPYLRSIELSPEAARQLDVQLRQLVELHKPHLDEDISLAKLASLLGVSAHQLSELLNIHKNTNFYEFLNNLRFQEALNFLSDAENDLTISDIAYRSGFNNRNSFYKVFKDKTGLTPIQYKRKAG